MNRRRQVAFLVVTGVGVLLACGGMPVWGQQATSAPAAGAELRILPEKARATLEGLSPKIEKPARAPQATSLPAQAAELVAYGERKIAEGQYSSAVEALEKAAGYEPANPRIRRLLGQAYFGLPNFGKAMTSLRDAVKAADDDVQTHLLLGQLYASQAQRPEAILHLRTALKCTGADEDNPAAAEALLTLGLLLDGEGYWTAALECYDRLGEWLGRHARAYSERPALREWALRPEKITARRGAVLLLLGRKEEAAADLERAYRRDRTDARTGKLLIRALVQTKKYGKAETFLQEMSAQSELRPFVPSMLADLVAETRDAKLPGRFWKAYRATGRMDASLAVGLARIAQRQGWSEQAVEILRTVAAEAPPEPDLWRMLLAGYAAQKQYGELAAAMERALRGGDQALDALAAAMPAIKPVGEEDVDRKLAELIRKGDSPVKAQMLYLVGVLAAAKERHLLAADLFRDAVDLKKDLFRAYEALVDAHMARKRPDQADAIIEELSRTAKDKPWADYLRGKAALGRGDTKEAVAALERAVGSDGKDLPSVRLLVRAYLMAGRAVDAETALVKALRDYPNETDLYRQLFDLYATRRQFEEAQSVAARLLRQQPDSLQGRMMLVELALQTGRREEALRLLQDLQKQAPEDPDVQLLAVRGLLGGGGEMLAKSEYEDVSEKLSAVIRANGAHRTARLQLSELMSLVGKHEEAAGVLATLFDENPADADTARRYVGMLLRAKRYPMALSAVGRFRKENAEDLWARLAELGLLAELKKFDQAEALASKWIADAAGEAKVLYRQELLRVLEQAKLHDKALKAVEDWIASGPGEDRLEQLRQVRVRLLAANGEWDKAAVEAEAILKSEPISPVARLAAAEGVEAKKYDEAMKLLARCRDTLTTMGEQLRALRKSLAGAAKLDEAARKDYEQRIEKAPDAVKTAVTAAVADGQYERALRTVDGWIRLSADAADAHRASGMIVLGQAKDPVKAQREAEAWLAKEPNALTPRRLLVAVLADANDFATAEKLVGEWLTQLSPAPVTQPAASQPSRDEETLSWLRQTAVRLKINRRLYAEAVEQADQGLRADPNDSDLMSLKSTALTELGKHDEALAVLEKAYAADPEDPSMNNNLGYLYADRGINLDKAEKMLQRAIRQRPGETAFLDSHAWVLYKLGRLREAGGVFRTLVEQRGEDDVEHGVILDHAGDAFWRLGWSDRAVELWKRALEQAKKDKRPQREVEVLLKNLPAKLQAVHEGRAPSVAPLGQNVSGLIAPPATTRPADTAPPVDAPGGDGGDPE